MKRKSSNAMLIGGTLAGMVFLLMGAVNVAFGQCDPVIPYPEPLNNNASSDTGEDIYPQLATDGQGTWVAVWESMDDLGGLIGDDSDILYSCSTDNGETWSDPRPLNTNAPDDAWSDYDTWPQLTTDGQGTWIAVWWYIEWPNEDYDILYSVSTDPCDGGVWTDPGVLWTWGADPQIATDGQGCWCAVCDCAGNICVACSTDNGENWSEGPPIGPGEHPDIATDAQGTWVVVWGGHFAWSTDCGETWSEPEGLLSGGWWPQVVSDGQGMWAAVSGDQFAWSTDPCDHWTEDPDGAPCGDQLATDGQGNWVVVCAGSSGGDYDVFWSRRMYDEKTGWSDWTPTPPQPLNCNADSDTGADDFPDVATNGQGDWIAVWQSNEPDLDGGIGTDYDILVAPFQLLEVACCLPPPQDQICIDALHQDCVALGGDPQGPGTTCQYTVCSRLKWSQPATCADDRCQEYAGCFWGWDQDSVYYWWDKEIVADDWLCETEEPVAEIHWWGSYHGWDDDEPPPDAPSAFHIGVWTDVPAGVDETFSHPGQMIHKWVVSRGELNERRVGCDFYPDAMTVPETSFRYDFIIPCDEYPCEQEWFYQGPASTIYWVSISAIYEGEPDHWWGWTTRLRDLASPAPDGAVKITDPRDPELYDVWLDGDPVEHPSGVSWDMAFVLTTSRTEACCFEDGSCQNLPPLECLYLGGTPGGPGTECAEPDTQACCLPDGSCVNMNGFCCEHEFGGIPKPGTCTAREACWRADESCGFVDPLCCDGVALGSGIRCDMIKWVQPPTFDPASEYPECFWGWDEDSVYGFEQIVADDWLCEDDKPVAGIHWWGSYIGYDGDEPPDGAPAGFHIGIWTDSGFPHPGTMSQEWLVPRADLNETRVGCDFYPNLMETTDTCFRYNFMIPQEDWFDQGPASTVHWVSISAMYSVRDCACNGDVDGDGFLTFGGDIPAIVRCIDGDCSDCVNDCDVDCDGDVDLHDIEVVVCQINEGWTDPSCCWVPGDPHMIPAWGWKIRKHYYGYDAVRIWDPTAPQVDDPFVYGQSIEDPPEVTWDAAFVITWPEPPPLRPMAEDCYQIDAPDYLNRCSPSPTCNSDDDCWEESICVPPPDKGVCNDWFTECIVSAQDCPEGLEPCGPALPPVCYAPKVRYLSIGRHPEQPRDTARRIKLSDGTILGWVGELRYVGPTSQHDGLWIADVVPADQRTYEVQWPDVVHVHTCEIAHANLCDISGVHCNPNPCPGAETCAQHSYHVQAIKLGKDITDEDEYSEVLELRTNTKWGDTVSSGPGGLLIPPEGICGLTDIMAAIACFQGSCGAPITWLDIAPSLGDQCPDQVVGLGDIMGAIAGFQGDPYPGLGPLNCP